MSKHTERSRHLPASDSPVGSLGGLVPPGATVKRWTTTRRVATAGEMNTNGAVRHPGAGQTRSRQSTQSQVTPARDTSVQQPTRDLAPASRRGVSDQVLNAYPREKTTGRATTTKSNVAPLARPEQGNAVASNFAVRLPPRQRPIQSPGPSNAHPYSATGSSPSVNQRARPSLPRPQTRQGSQNSTASLQNLHSPGFIPPHLRAPVRATPTPAAPASSANIPSSTPQTELLSAAHLEARQIFFRRSVKLKKRVNGHVVELTGIVSIYELAEQPATIWELIIDEQQVVREDVRRLLPSFTNGSTVTIRRRDKPGDVVRAGDVQFDDILAAQEFEKAANEQRKKWAESRGPIFEQKVQEKASATPKASVDEDATKLADNSSQIEQQEPAAQSTINPANSAGSAQLLDDNLEVPRSENQHDANEAHTEEQTSATPASEELLIDFEAEISSPQTPIRLVEDQPLVDLSSLPEGTMTASPYIHQLMELDPRSWEPQEASELSEPSSAMGPDLTLTLQPPIEEVKTFPPPQSVVNKEAEIAFLNLKTTDPDPYAKRISQDALKVLYGLPMQAYEDMIRAVPKLMGLLNEADYSLSRQVNGSYFAPFQVSWLHLRRLNEYNSLTYEDRQVVLGVVYATVLHRQGRIVRPRRDILNLRGPRQPCPDEVRKLNELVRSGNRLNNTRGIISGRPAGRTELQGPPERTNTTVEKKAREQTMHHDNPSHDDVNSSSSRPDTDSIQTHQRLAAEAATIVANSRQTEQTPTPVRQLEHPQSQESPVALDQPLRASLAVDSDEDDENEATVRPASAWDSIGLEEEIEPEASSTGFIFPNAPISGDGHEPTISSNGHENGHEPTRTLSSSRWASQSSQQQQISNTFGLDGASSDIGDGAPEVSQAPRTPGHQRTDTNGTQQSNVSDMTGLANQIKSTPASCQQS